MTADSFLGSCCSQASLYFALSLVTAVSFVDRYCPRQLLLLECSLFCNIFDDCCFVGSYYPGQLLQSGHSIFSCFFGDS